MDVIEFFESYHVRKCAEGKERFSCDDCDLHCGSKNHQCGEFFIGCPLPSPYVFKLKKV